MEDEFLKKLEEAEKRDEKRKSSYKLLCMISSGAFSSVWKAQHNKNSLIAVKIIKKTTLEIFKNEVKIHHKASYNKNQCIVKYFGNEIKAQDCRIFMELGKYSLRKVIKTGKKNNNVFILQVIHAVHHLHSLNIVHRDLKPENFIVFQNSNIKLCDFGLSRISMNEKCLKTLCGTLPYMAPELFAKKLIYNGFQTDIWSMGVVIYEIVHLKLPFEGKSIFELKSRIINLRRRHYDANVSSNIRLIISQCLRIKERYTIQEIFELLNKDSTSK